MLKYLRFPIVVGFGLFLVIGFNNEEKKLYSFSGFTMGTTYEIQFAAASSFDS